MGKGDTGEPGKVKGRDRVGIVWKSPVGTGLAG